jgi:SAM-dependent methyltransferase
MDAPTNLATEEFWEEDYYREIELPARPNSGFPYERCLMQTLEELAPVPAGASVFEIGCAPARWLVWYAERFGARVTGLEYTRKGVQLSRDNLAAAGVEGEIHDGDFFSNDLALGEHDLVLSLGFIEHFDDVAATFARHVDFVAKGGRLVVGMPNFRGLIGFFQGWADRSYLQLHNPRTMDPSLYANAADMCGMQLDKVRYIDGIDPDVVKVSGSAARLALMPFRAWRKLPLSDHVNGRLISSYLLLTFTRLR